MDELKVCHSLAQGLAVKVDDTPDLRKDHISSPKTTYPSSQPSESLYHNSSSSPSCANPWPRAATIIIGGIVTVLGALVVLVPRDMLFIWPVLEEWMPRMTTEVSK
jgi:hypothetical protein